ncbi:toprim domain-containing protein, partial [Xanthomonas hortorum pv. hederae]
MRNLDYERRIDSAKQRAHGRWTEILRYFGAEERLLKRRNMPCPLCGGVDRFQYTDKYGEGNYHCRHCGAGGGFKLLQALKDWDFHTALQDVEKFLGLDLPVPAPGSRKRSPEGMRRLAQRVWNEARPIAEGDQAHRYLCARGLTMPVHPENLRFHPALGYFVKDDDGSKSRQVAEYPALLARIQDPAGQMVTVHRTYLKDGRKAPVRNPKKSLSSGIHGAAIRLFEATEELAFAEGIETALAVHLATGLPVWATIDAGNMEKLWIPPQVRRVSIYADNDANGSFVGQAAAFALARRLARERLADGNTRQVQVFVPPKAGDDWADVWRRRVSRVKRPARPARPAPT